MGLITHGAECFGGGTATFSNMQCRVHKEESSTQQLSEWIPLRIHLLMAEMFFCVHWEWIAKTEGGMGLSGPQVLRGKVQDWPISQLDTHSEATAPKCCANMGNKISSVTHTAFNVKQHGKMYWSLNNILHVKSICQYCHLPTHS